MYKQKISIKVILFYPLSLLYGGVIVLRNLLFDFGILREKEFDLPVISVGNITVGGTGKTPHIEYLAELLKDEFNIAILSRGYKRKTTQFLIAHNESAASEIGDEPRQLKQKFPDIIVAVDRKRVNGIQQLLEHSKQLDLILLDDAFQHRHVKPGKNILLIDYNRLITNDSLLPAGKLREPASGKKRADIILVTKSPTRLKPIEMRNLVKHLSLDFHQHLYFTTIEYGKLNPVFKSGKNKDLKDFQKVQAPVLILAGIANPRAIRKYARQISTNIHEIYFTDHHAYTMKDLEKIKRKFLAINNPDAIILTTEKDAMRLQDLAMENILKNALYFVTIKVKFLNDDADEFNNLVINYVRNNKRNNILHKGTN